MKFLRRSSTRSMPSSSASASIVRSITYGRLGAPAPAIGVGRRRVREHARELDAVVRDRVRARRRPRHRASGMPRGDELEVGAHRGGHAGAAVRDRAVLRRGERVLR
jgi:hypothetical protein